MSVSSIGGPVPPVVHSAAPQAQPASDDGDGDTDSGKESAIGQAAESRPSAAPQPGAPGQQVNILA